MKEMLARIMPKRLLTWHRLNNQKRRYRCNKALDPSEYEKVLARWFKETAGEELDLVNPRTFNQKIQWLKLNDSTPEKGRLADKYLVRRYVADRIGGEYLVPLLGVWDNPYDIDFDKLPDRFVLKCTHGCGWNIIVKDKKELNIPAARRKLKRWLATDYAYFDGLELHYHYCEPRIVAEAYLENSSEGGSSDLYDYKFWCFNGRVEYIMFLENRARDLRMAFYDRDWNIQPFVYSHPKVEREVPRPRNLARMIELSEKLAQGQAHVRVDFYRTDEGKVYFGEMTFSSCNGACIWDPPEANVLMGSLFEVKKVEGGVR